MKKVYSRPELVPRFWEPRPCDPPLFLHIISMMKFEAKSVIFLETLKIGKKRCGGGEESPGTSTGSSSATIEGTYACPQPCSSPGEGVVRGAGQRVPEVRRLRNGW
jgi:hypothetical protein